VEEYDDLEHPAQQQEERRTMTIGFKFHQSLKNSTTTFQVVAGQPATANPIDVPTRSPIWTSLTTTRSSGLAFSEIRTKKPEESTWLGVAI
jgi:hypothetical protein